MTGFEAMPDRVARVKANNPGPFSLDGTNTYIVDGAWVVDPGPDQPEHVKAVAAAVAGTAEGILLTHRHSDHAGAAPALAERLGGLPVQSLADQERVGPFTAIATPGHAPDHVCLLMDDVLFSGDTVLGSGSVFVQPGGGALAAYLDSLRRLRALELEWLCPGHGPIVSDPAAKLDQYVAHRLEREARLLEALQRGLRASEELLDAVWSDAPPELRMGAAITLAAHLEKLGDEGLLPPGVEDPIDAFPGLAALRDD